MDIKEKQAWRTIVAVLQETGYDKLYDEEVHIVAEYLRRCEQQCKKQKEVIDKAIEYVEGHKFTMKHYEPYGTPMGSPNYETHNIEGYYQLLDILNEVSK